MTSATTSPPEVKSQITAFKDLENPIMEAKAMAALLVKFYDGGTAKFETFEEGNAFTFGLYEVERRLNDLNQQFQACFDFKEPK